MASPKDAGAGNDHIVNDCEHTLTPNPSAVFVLDLTIVEDGGLVELNTPPMDSPSKRNLVWVEVFPTRFADNFLRRVAKYIHDRLRGIQKSRIK
ncbi:MAG: hypothetical protein LQ350_000909 [Teloschistes chrysophthalmus]|nr:MAG: hypothetical protein LQ350_000909 [Niorma chrysophthalma]